MHIVKVCSLCPQTYLLNTLFARGHANKNTTQVTHSLTVESVLPGGLVTKARFCLSISTHPKPVIKITSSRCKDFILIGQSDLERKINCYVSRISNSQYIA